MTPCLIAFGLLFVETSINITYYKDCVFAITSLCMFLGMFWVNRKYKGAGKSILQDDSVPDVDTYMMIDLY